MLLGISTNATVHGPVTPIPAKVKEFCRNVVYGSSCGEEDALVGKQGNLLVNDNVVDCDDRDRIGLVCDIDFVNLGFRPCASLVHHSKGCVEYPDLAVRTKWRFQIGRTIVSKCPCIGRRCVHVGQTIVVKRQSPSIKTIAEELYVFPCLRFVERHRSVGYWFHVAKTLRRGLNGINRITKHVFHDHCKGVLVAFVSSKVDLTGDINTASCRDTVGDGVNHTS